LFVLKSNLYKFNLGRYSVVPGRFSASLNASAAVSACDGRVYTWGHPRPWLGRGGDAADGEEDNVWAGGCEPAPVRFAK
jgi:hypothetical protein